MNENNNEYEERKRIALLKLDFFAKEMDKIRDKYYNNINMTQIALTGDFENTIGLFFNCLSKDIEEATNEIKFPIYITMPCGESYYADCAATLPKHNLQCSCGDKKHYFVKYSFDIS